VLELFSPADRERVGELLSRRSRGDVEVALPATGGSPTRARVSVRPLPDGRAVLLAESVPGEEPALRLRLAFADSVGSFLASSLDHAGILARVARLAVPHLADFCVVDVLQEDHTLRRAAAAHRDPGRSEFAWNVDLSGSTDRALSAGEPGISSGGAGYASLMSVPLAARGRPLGVVSFGSAEPGRYGPADLELAGDFARHASLAVENARLYGERDHVARTLQQSLLPPALPEIPGVEIAARYLPAGAGNEVGGDFYDLFPTLGGWALVIGDVCGKGPEAAAVTALARYTIRAASMRESGPVRILLTLNEAIRQHGPADRFCTGIFASLVHRAAGPRLDFACGGHPLPLLVRPGGQVERLGDPGTLLGALPRPRLSWCAVDLEPDDALLLYTDGVIEARNGAGELFGEERLAEVLGGCAGLEAEATAGCVEHAVAGFQSGPPRDDLAFLVLRATGSGP
jgi:serine phosphatase RsbU (regulator of sigma subunit)